MDGCRKPRKLGEYSLGGLIFSNDLLAQAKTAQQAHGDQEVVLWAGGQGGVLSLRGKLLEAQFAIRDDLP